MKQSLVYLFLILLLASCGTQRLQVSKAETQALSRQLGFTVNKKDNIPLMREVCQWLGTPYRLGGTTRQGIDCSGFVGAVYQNVYHKKLHRTVGDIYKLDCKRVGKRGVKQGDLLFFNFQKRHRRQLTHMGIFLKRGYFVHASTSKGVMVNHLSQSYYKKGWRKAGKINR